MLGKLKKELKFAKKLLEEVGENEELIKKINKQIHLLEEVELYKKKTSKTIKSSINSTKKLKEEIRRYLKEIFPERKKLNNLNNLESLIERDEKLFERENSYIQKIKRILKMLREQDTDILSVEDVYGTYLENLLNLLKKKNLLNYKNSVKEKELECYRWGLLPLIKGASIKDKGKLHSEIGKYYLTTKYKRSLTWIFEEIHRSLKIVPPEIELLKECLDLLDPNYNPEIIFLLGEYKGICKIQRKEIDVDGIKKFENNEIFLLGKAYVYWSNGIDYEDIIENINSEKEYYLKYLPSIGKISKKYFAEKKFRQNNLL